MRTCSVCEACFPDEITECPAHAAEGSPLEVQLAGGLLIDGKYAIEQRLGQGGMGVIYRARHVGVDRPFAVKVIRGYDPDDPSFIARFRAEAMALGRLKHPAIVDVTDFGVDPRDGGLPYLVMEYLEGRSLADHCRRHPLSVEEALPVLAELAAAIDFAHEHGVLHRDLKPANVFLAKDHAGEVRVKVLDFGLARMIASPDTERGNARPGPRRVPPAPVERLPAASVVADVEPTVSMPALDANLQPTAVPGELVTGLDHLVGTPAYMAPEILRGGRASPASDVYAFGVIAYEILVGRRPYKGTLEEMLGGHLFGAPAKPSQARPELPPEFDDAIVSALEKDPARRPQGAREYVRLLRRAASATHRRRWNARELPRRLGLAAAVGVAAALAAAALVRTDAGALLEARSVDARFALRPLRPPHPALTFVVLDDESLRADPTPLAQRADEFARRLEALFGAGAGALALDFIPPATWSRSADFSRVVLRHADALVLPALAAPGGEILGPEALAGLSAAALGPQRVAGLFGLTNLVQDGDGVVRRARLRFAASGGGHHESFAARASARLGWQAPAEAPETFWIDQTGDWRRVPRISWQDVEQRLRDEPESVRGRLVLVGGDFVGAGDAHVLPRRSSTSVEVPGVVLQGLIAHTILSGFPYRDAGALPVHLMAAALAFTAAAALLCLATTRPVLIVLVATALAAVAAALVAFRAGLVLSILPPLAAFVLALFAAAALRTRLSAIPGTGDAE